MENEIPALVSSVSLSPSAIDDEINLGNTSDDSVHSTPTDNALSGGDLLATSNISEPSQDVDLISSSESVPIESNAAEISVQNSNFNEGNPMNISIEVIDKPIEEPKQSRGRIVVPKSTFNPVASPNGRGVITQSKIKIPKREVPESEIEPVDSRAVSPGDRSGSTSRRREIERMKEQKRLEEEAQFTFMPMSISKKKFSSKDSDEDRFSVLYSDAKKRHLDMRNERLKDRLDEELTFSPKLSPRVLRSSSRDTISRISAAGTSRSMSSDGPIAVKHTAKSIAAVKTPVKNEFTYSPSISKRAKSIDRSRAAKGKDSAAAVAEIGERLYQQSQRQRERQERKKAEVESSRFEGCTFSPRTNSSSGRFSTRSRSANPTTSTSSNNLSMEFPDRMKSYEQYKNRRHQEAVKVQQETVLADITFRPQLIAKQPQHQQQELYGVQLPVHQRLSLQQERMSSKLAEIEAAVYAEVTFKPVIHTKHRTVSPAAIANSNHNATLNGHSTVSNGHSTVSNGHNTVNNGKDTVNNGKDTVNNGKDRLHHQPRKEKERNLMVELVEEKTTPAAKENVEVEVVSEVNNSNNEVANALQDGVYY